MHISTHRQNPQGSVLQSKVNIPSISLSGFTHKLNQPRVFHYVSKHIHMNVINKACSNDNRAAGCTKEHIMQTENDKAAADKAAACASNGAVQYSNY